MNSSSRTLRLCTAAVGAAFLANNAAAQMLPIPYQLQLQVRADTGGTAFNLPNGSTFNSVSASINNQGKVAVKVNTVGGTTSPGLYFGGQGTGSLVFNTNDPNAILGEAFLNNNAQATFTRSVSTDPATDGIYLYNSATGTTTRVTNGPLGATSYTNPQVNDVGVIGMRAKFSSPQALLSYNLSTSTFTNYVTEQGGDPNSRYSFLYAPAFNNNNLIAAQANISGQASTLKELRIWSANGSSILVASGDSSTGPTFFAFDNGISLNNNNQVAFTTRTSTAASTRRIVVGDGTTTTMFPTVSSGAGFTSIDSFPPIINDNGLVAFRGNDNQATPRDSVFVTNGTTVQRIAGVGDTLMTDTGARVVGFLMGAVDINSSGAVSFGVQYTDGGNAIYVAYVPVVPLSAFSRKQHGTAGTFDENMPLTGTPGVECRQGTGGTSDMHELVVNFAVPVTFSSAAVTSGSAGIESTATNGNAVSIKLRDVANAQTLRVTMFGVNDGTNISDVVIPMSFLLGDLNRNGTVSASDVAQVKAQAGTTTKNTFRSDVVANGTVNATDIAVVKSRAGSFLP